MQREAHTSVARERFTCIEGVFAQLRALQSTHAPRQRQHNCAIVYDLPPNLKPRACLDSRVFGGKRGLFSFWFYIVSESIQWLPTVSADSILVLSGRVQYRFPQNFLASNKGLSDIFLFASSHGRDTWFSKLTSQRKFSFEIGQQSQNLRGNTSEHARCLLVPHAQVRATLPDCSSRGLYR